MEVVLLLLLIVIVVVVLYNLKKDSEKTDIQQKHETAKQDEEQKRLVALEEQYGKRSASLDKETLHVWVFNESRKVVIFYHDFYDKKQVYSFDEIVGCDLSSKDNVSEKVIPAQSETTFVTKTSGTSMAGRALVGAVVAGPVGAIIGGATAKKTTVGVTKTTPETTVKTVRTTWCAVIHVIKDGVEDRIPCYGYGSNKLKTMIDDILLARNLEIEKTEN